MKNHRHLLLRLTVYLIGASLIVGCAAAPADPPPSGPRIRMTIAAFEDQSHYSYGKQRQDASAEEALESALEQESRVLLIRSNAWRLLVDEAALEQQAEGDPIQKARLIAGQVEADAVIIGEITRINVRSDTDDSPIGGTRIEHSAAVDLQARVIDPANAQILLEESAYGSVTKTGRVFSVSQEQRLVKEAIERATRSLARKIVSQL
ncbi:hypothetical protein GF339_18500 [candidate division KSB3 bacterium]|jgi:curli biogenesis system outer membrane secretion channel CsgG|uniref:Curli production assembly/transport component CsgG n=1 Tax=candidate division KSB3 bacterium TaxID=2044937 RepID=A0A9D5Q861_9BACT|nr:hypothetical protein [candidate division KSB3 bacterium]MBD3326581.1 hypothetical protein [candidate division KSB3 bacterium]